MITLSLTESNASTIASTHMRDRADESKLLAVVATLPGHRWSVVRGLCSLPVVRVERARQRLIAAGKLTA